MFRVVRGARRSTLLLMLGTLGFAANARAEPQSDVAQRTFLLGCGTHVVGGAPLKTADADRLRAAGLTASADYPPWVASNLNGEAGPASVYRAAAETGDVFVIAYDRKAYCQLLSRGNAAAVSDAVTGALAEKPWTGRTDVSTGPMRRREYELKTSGGRVFGATVMSPSAAAPADADLVMVFLGRKR